MGDTVYTGSCFRIIWATTNNGRRPASESFDELSVQNQARLLVLFELLATTSRIRNVEHFRKIAGTECFEFKRGQIRMPCFYYGRQTVVVTHGFVKKSDKTPLKEIDRAMLIRQEHIDREGR